MLEDTAFLITQSLAARLMRRLGIPEHWQPKSKAANALLWAVILAGAVGVVCLIVSK